MADDLMRFERVRWSLSFQCRVFSKRRGAGVILILSVTGVLFLSTKFWLASHASIQYRNL
jgi:hypothetical protein